jgi:DEAD/DEAH box helicase domain-containing protein
MAVAREIEPWNELLQAGRADERLVREAFEGLRPPALRELPEMDERLTAALRACGIEQLYEHQHDAFERAFAGPTIVTTSTASGKSLCFNLPVAETLLTDARARALYLYPTKALSQDQARAIHALGLGSALRPAIYDGDTRREDRAQIPPQREHRPHQP